jgi:hypothetical protein
MACARRILTCLYTDFHWVGVNSFLDVARKVYKELNNDVNTYFNELKGARPVPRHISPFI